MRITCFSQVWIGFLSFGEADHRDEVPFTTDHTKGTRAINLTVGVDADLDHLAEVAPVRWHHRQVACTPFLPHCILQTHVTKQSPHYRAGFMICLLGLCKLLRILLCGRFITSLYIHLFNYLYSYRPMDIYFILWATTQN